MALTTTATSSNISSDCQLNGDLSSQKDVVIEGRFSGTFRGHGKLRIGAGAEVIGKVEAGSFHLEAGGKVTASVKIGSGFEPSPQSLSASTKLLPATATPSPLNKGKILRGLEEIAKFALGRK